MEVRMTDIATRLATNKSSVETVRAKASAELQDLMDSGMTSIPDLIFHVFQDGDQDYIITGQPYGALVDSATYDEDMEINSGFFEGKKVMMPSGDSD